MGFHGHDGLRYHTFETFPEEVAQGVFTRQGGVSPAPWASLNMGGMVGDTRVRVSENRERALGALDRSAASVFDAWLVHSADVLIAESPRPAGEPPQRADAILTDRQDITLLLRFADCVPILFYEPQKHVVGMAHAGWLGTLRGIARATVQRMVSHYGCEPGAIRAAIGPAIGADHYEVGPDVVSRFRDSLGAEADTILQSRDGRTYLDLWEANRRQLASAGVEHVEVSGICTACQLDDWYSHRAENGRTGRFGAIIALRT
jgi:YfiH family protein